MRPCISRHIRQGVLPGAATLLGTPALAQEPAPVGHPIVGPYVTLAGGFNQKGQRIDQKPQRPIRC